MLLLLLFDAYQLAIRVDLERPQICGVMLCIAYVRYKYFANLQLDSHIIWNDVVRRINLWGLNKTTRTKKKKTRQTTKRSRRGKIEIADHHLRGICQLYVPWSLVKSYCFDIMCVYLLWCVPFLFVLYLVSSAHARTPHHIKNDLFSYLSSPFHLNSHHF